MRNGKERISLLCITLFLSFMLLGCDQIASVKEGLGDEIEQKKEELLDGVVITQPQADSKKEEVVVKPVEKEEQKEENLKDNGSLYEEENKDEPLTMYLTVSTGNEADGSNHTWTEVNTYSADYYTEKGIDRYKVEGILQIDEGDGIGTDSFGYEEQVPNVSVQVRGQTSSHYTNKNYKIRIKDGKGSYLGQRTLNLNKHAEEPYRFMNKLCYGMLDQIPQLIGGRTRFVHLYVCDTTQGGSKEYEDYGLYTMVEQVNRTYLKNRNLDENGQLYKVTFFEWDKYDAISTPVDSPDFDEAAFSEYMEIKGDRDNEKINQVVEEIQNYMRPIDEIINEYFDEENLCYWMAFNILLGNHDSGSRNLFLYSPLNSEKFYMICWDLDASLQRNYCEKIHYSEGNSWERGMSQYLVLALARRMLKEEKYRKMLDDAVKDLHEHYMNEEIVNKQILSYKEITESYLYGGADSENAKLSKEAYEELTGKIGSELEENYQYYMDTRDNPWPFFVNIPICSDQQTILSWDASYDPNAEAVTYSYKLYRDDTFTDLVSEEDNLVVPSATIDELEPGFYYLRVTSKNESGKEQDCFDYLATSDGRGKIYACLGFQVLEDGTVELMLEAESGAKETE